MHSYNQSKNKFLFKVNTKMDIYFKCKFAILITCHRIINDCYLFDFTCFQTLPTKWSICHVCYFLWFKVVSASVIAA